MSLTALNRQNVSALIGLLLTIPDKNYGQRNLGTEADPGSHPEQACALGHAMRNPQLFVLPNPNRTFLDKVLGRNKTIPATVPNIRGPHWQFAHDVFGDEVFPVAFDMFAFSPEIDAVDDVKPADVIKRLRALEAA